MVAGGFSEGAVLEPIFQHFSSYSVEDVNLTEVLHTVREMGQDFCAQIWWRSMPYRLDPYTIFISAQVGASEEDVQETLEKSIFGGHRCCRHPCTNKINRAFRNVRNMRADKAFCESQRLVARHLRLANMWSERQLAQYRLDTRGSQEDIETDMSKAFLGQVLREHMSKGFLDPRVNHRQWLLEDDVPIRARKEVKKPRKGSGLFLKDPKLNKNKRSQVCPG